MELTDDKGKPRRWIDRAVRAAADAVTAIRGISVAGVQDYAGLASTPTFANDVAHDAFYALHDAAEHLTKAHRLLRMVGRSGVEFGPGPQVFGLERQQRKLKVWQEATRLLVENGGFIATFVGDAPTCNRCKREQKEGHTDDCRVGSLVAEVKALRMTETEHGEDG